MFTDFFYTLKNRKVPVSITEWMTLMEALSKGYISNLDEFYYLARAILVKSENHYDQYDVAFQECFKGIAGPAEINQQILDWLKDAVKRKTLTEEERALFKSIDFDKLIEEFEKRLKEQTEQHDGGGNWIGRGGTSPFGHSGYHPGGIRVGGESGYGSAAKVAAERRFQNYRSDLTLDIRQIKMALRRLRQLSRTGYEDELDLDETIDATCKNAGELEFMWMRSRKNAVKVLLLMDVGGSMNEFAMLCSQLFSAAHSSSHFKDFKYYYFHNCIYDNLYQDIERRTAVSTDHLLRTMETDYKVVLVGDAAMAPTELVQRDGIISYYEHNETPGIVWLKRIADHFTHCVWLNPDISNFRDNTSVQMIRKIFPMFELTLDGIGEAMKKLTVKT